MDIDSLYHYTKLNILQQIVKNEKIVLRATHFQKFDMKDYKWIRTEIAPIIKQLCEEHEEQYDPELLNVNPFIISFCDDGNSEYMWEKYGDHFNGIKLVFNRTLLKTTHSEGVDEKNNSHTINKLETFLPCTYIKDVQKESKDALLGYVQNKELATYNYDDKLRFGSAALIQQENQDEAEFRYICSYPIVSIINQDLSIEDDPMPKFTYLYLEFPKETLEGIEFGKNVSKDDIETSLGHMERLGYQINFINDHKVEIK